MSGSGCFMTVLFLTVQTAERYVFVFICMFVHMTFKIPAFHSSVIKVNVITSTNVC